MNALRHLSDAGGGCLPAPLLRGAIQRRCSRAGPPAGSNRHPVMHRNGAADPAESARARGINNSGGDE